MVSWKLLRHLFIFLITLLWVLITPVFAMMPISSTQNAATIAIAQNPEQQGKALYDAGRFAEAASVLEQAVQQYQQQGDSLHQAIVLSNLALTYQQLGEIQQAKQAIQQSLDLLQNLPSTTDRLSVQAQVLDVQGRLQFTQGQAEAALATWQQAAQLYEQLDNAAGLTANQIDQSQALQVLGFYRRAIDLLVQVLELPSQVPLSSELQLIYQRDKVDLEEVLGLQASVLTQTELCDLLSARLLLLPDSIQTAVALQNLGEVLRNSGSLVMADQVLQQGLSIAETQYPAIAAAIQLDLGNAARAQAESLFNSEDPAQKDQAEAAANDAFNYYKEVAETEGMIGVRAALNELSFRIERGELVEAQLLLSPLRQRLDPLPESHAAIYARINFAQSQVKLFENNLSDSSQILELENLLDQIQQQAARLNSPRAISYVIGLQGHLAELQQDWTTAEQLTREALSVAQEVVSVPEQGFVTAPDVRYLWQWQLGRILKAQADQSKNAAQYQDATLAYETAIDILQSLQLDLVAANQDEQFNFRDSIEPAYRQYIQLLLRSAPTNQLLEQLNAPNHQAQDQLKKARLSLQNLQTTELQNFLRAACINIRNIDLDTIVQTTSEQQQEDRTALIYPIVLPERLSVVLKLPQSEQLFHYSTEVKEEAVQTTLQELHKQLIIPSSFDKRNPESFAEAQQLYNWLIHPAGELLKQQDIKTLVFVLDGTLQKIPMSILYDGEKYLIENYSIALAPGLEIPDPQPLPRQNLRLLLAGTNETVEIENKRFPGVATALAQVDEIAKQSEMAGYKVDRLWNETFTAQNIQSKIQQSLFHIVHLVTHGEFSSNQDGTFIIDSERKVKVTELGQILKTRDQNQVEPIELLVFSACETAKDDRAALGMAGVAVQSGARSTVATLWSIYTEESKVLMLEFYRQLSNPELTKAEALKNAQIYLLNHPDKNLHHPVMWAPFVLLGNWL